MNARNKVWTLLATVLVSLVILACTCGPLSSLLATPTPLPTATRIPTPTPLPEPMRGLEGVWMDTAENTAHTLVWTGDTYHVVSSIDDTHGNCAVTSENWDGSTFTWTYYVAETDVSVTIQATSVAGNSMYNNWWSTNGNSGTDIFTRQ